jgi:ankyrin repeat protein
MSDEQTHRNWRLIKACKSGNYDAAKKQIEDGADPNARRSTSGAAKMFELEPQTPLLLACARKGHNYRSYPPTS